MSDTAQKKKARKRLSNKKCAKRAGVSVRTLQRWQHCPQLQYPAGHMLRGRLYRYLDEIEDWEKAHQGFVGCPETDGDDD